MGLTNPQPETHNSNLIKTPSYNKKEFLRAQIAAFLGTTIDYMAVLGLTELAGIWYIYSNIVGASLGAITNFLLGRYWAFDSKEDYVTNQAVRYAVVSLGSLILNTGGLYLLTEFSSLNYMIAKVVIGILIAVSYNYLMQKYFVFKK